MTKSGFTLFESMIVMIVIGVLATIGVTHYRGIQDIQFDREAQANIRLIAVAERSARMENNTTTFVGCGSTALVNGNLRLSIPAGITRNWDYRVFARPAAAPTTFCIDARRIRSNVAQNQWWSMLDTENDPTNTNSCPARGW
ncbi:MAG TPA: type II secretion system protein [Candidatus Omnitrophota bacterium]|nr:type II secretion system protein [Candidatus Omnitrophota bacterium]HPT06524.1 type II secretion system protein [Candidatus Omnitrophota bacterium]